MASEPIVVMPAPSVERLSLAERRAKPLGIGFKIAYGAGQTVEGMITAIVSVFLFFYITTVCGLSGTLTGLAILLSLAIDAFVDPLMGSFSDGLRSRWGRRVPPMALSLLPISLAMGLMFSIPRVAPGLPLFACVLALLLTLRCSQSAFVVPYLGAGAELSDDYDERSGIVAYRSIFAVVSTLACYVLGFQLFFTGPKGLLDRAAYAPFAWTCAVLLFVGGAIATRAVWSAQPRLYGPPANLQPILRRFGGEVAEMFRNPSFRALFGGCLMFFIGQGLFVTLGLHAYKYFWGLSTGAIQLVSIASALGLALGIPLTFAIARHCEKRTMGLIAFLTVAGVEGLVPLAQIAGILPTDATAVGAILVGCSILIGAMVTLIGIAMQSAMADASDQHEHLFGARREGLFYAGLSFAAKAATGIGSFLSGVALDVIGFPGDRIAAGENVALTAATIRGLGFAYGPAAAAITVLSAGALLLYRIDRAAHADIMRKLGR